MGTEQDHLGVAARNRQAIEFLQGDKRFPEWIATVAFYTTLHLVDALIYHDEKEHGSNHPKREGILKGKRRYATIWEHYRPLKQASSIARYLHDQTGRAYRSFTDFMTYEDVISRILGYRLHRLEESVRRLLDQPPPAKPS